jgi:hypothetical protein
MIPLRHPIALAALAVGLAALALVSAVQGATLMNEVMTTPFTSSGGATSDEVMAQYFGRLVFAESLQRLPAWATLAALVAGLGALTLVVLRSRARAR